MSQKIHVTKDYSKFKLVRGNRPVTTATINVKIREMRRKNLLEDFPIVVRRNCDGKWEIFDGQNRFKAAEKLGLPIYYKISRSIAATDISAINTAQRGWKPKDYLMSNVALGKPEYIKLKAFVDETGIPLSVAIDLLGNREGFTNCIQGGFKEGDFVCKDETHARQVAAIINVIRQWVKWATDRSFVIAISRIMRSVALDADRLRQKLEYQSRSLVKCANWLQYVELLDGIYNYHVQAKAIVSIREEVRKWAVKNRPDEVAEKGKSKTSK